jgi:hypothetical protein
VKGVLVTLPKQKFLAPRLRRAVPTGMNKKKNNGGRKKKKKKK